MKEYWKSAASELRSVRSITGAALFAAMSVLAFKKVHPIIIICISAVLGIAAGYLGLL